MLRVYCEGSVGLRLQWWSRVLYTSLQRVRWRCIWFSCCLLGYSLYLYIRCIVDVLILELEKDFLRNSSILQVGWSSCDHPIKTLFPMRRIDRVELMTLSIGTSLALVTLVGLLLNYTPWGLRLIPITTSLSILTISFIIIGLFREYQERAKNFQGR